MVLDAVIPAARVERRLREQIDEVCARRQISTAEFLRDAVRDRLVREKMHEAQLAASQLVASQS